MKVAELLIVLGSCNPNLDVAIEQIFNEHRSIQLRSIEVINNCVVLKDHYVRVSEFNTFVAFDGTTFEVPNFQRVGVGSDGL